MENLKNDLEIKEIIEIKEYYWQDFVIEYMDNNNKRQRLKDYIPDGGFDSKFYFNLLKSFGYKYCYVSRSVPGDEVLEFLTYKPLNRRDEDIFSLDEIGSEIFTDPSRTRSLV